ncbi:D-glycero-beta-D-manno-heptose 1,7-bisphosphate 7-phosphatase [Spiribacter vilamensis]|uniref:D,D-heptose 1,7-bisphosphate phosphatase n=1 Tax=Spiribacter vilamensis TaxID=531306 RepID=A0A4Q8D2I1_9GAMM|nr:D-glycero-beta-D-manno-heptose 1,7-bisphosphate 7-phosphatase [Spiribacter vilamensis]RZU99517.1 D-alpha,beta-D-heptose 1,7-bisphosphate phosphatase [Spiribacter vilamensis]TVO61512.1 D-glycero-beta-D-manno-heptose 1,7-bisphosphate 7-phosphatase [Spiribacter vilamensis]
MRPGCVLLDRDGVINEDADSYILSVEAWRPIAGSLEAIGRLTAAGIPVAVCTNQSAIARGMLSNEGLAAIHHHMRTAVAGIGGALAGIFFCPHGPEAGCGCRKPAPGLINEALRQLGCQPADAIMIGDSRRDIDAALRAGVPAWLVRTGNGRHTESRQSDNIPVYDDLAAAVDALLA